MADDKTSTPRRKARPRQIDRMITRLGAVAVLLFGLLFAVLHYIPSAHGAERPDPNGGLGQIILFTAFCMRLQMNHCYVTSMDDSPFSTVKQCEEAIDWVDKMQWNAYSHAPPREQNLCGCERDISPPPSEADRAQCREMCGNGNAPIPKAHWCTTRNW